MPKLGCTTSNLTNPSLTCQKVNLFPVLLEQMVALAGSRGGGRAWGGDLTFLKNLQSNSLPTGKSFQSNATKFPHPGLHIAVIYPKAGPKKGTIKISPNKTLQNLFILRGYITNTCSCYSCNYMRFNHNTRRLQGPLGKSPHFVTSNIPFLVKRTKKVSFISLQ